jgi:UDP-glucose 4-epimerase|tara:strand:- start:794 stop:1405 length:612 start_codon:yes stop_codon:yes gene_type:complete
MSEEVVPRPEDSYGIAKLAVEDELRISHEMFGLPYIIFRPHNVYGERQNFGDKYRNVVGIFMNQIMQGLPMTIFGDGRQTRAFSHIADIVPAIANSIRVLEAYNEIFNIGSDKPCSINQLASAVAEAFEVECEIYYLDPRNEVLEAYSDHSKAERILKVSSAIPLEEGLRRFAVWAREQGPRESKDFTDTDIEIPINLPPSWR